MLPKEKIRMKQNFTSFLVAAAISSTSFIACNNTETKVEAPKVDTVKTEVKEPAKDVERTAERQRGGHERRHCGDHRGH